MASSHITRQLPSPPQAILRPLRQQRTDKVAVSAQDGLIILSVDSIAYCEARSNYCMIHLSGGAQILASKTLKQVEQQLAAAGFIRIHQSYVVNPDAMARVGREVELTSGKVLPVSRAKRQEVIARIRAHIPVI